MTQAEEMFDKDAPYATTSGEDLVAEPEPGYRWKHLIMAVLMIAGGCWFAYDGWIKWPAENNRIAQVQRDKDAAQSAGNTSQVEALAKELQSLNKHTEMDLLIQKALAFVLPAFGIFWRMDDPRHPRRLSHVRQHPSRPRASAGVGRRHPAHRQA